MNILAKHICCLFFLFLNLSAIQVFGQHDYDIQVVALKNGSKLRGRVLSTSSNDRIDFQTTDGVKLNFSSEDIISIETAPHETTYTQTKPEEKKENSTRAALEEMGFGRHGITYFAGPLFRALDSTGTTLIGTESAFAIGHGFYYGFHFTPRYNAGIGVLVQTYSRPMIGLIVSNRYFFANRKPMKFFVQGLAGYSQLMVNFRGDSSDGGLVLDGSIGLAIRNSPRKHVTISIGVLRQAHHYIEKEIDGIDVSGTGGSVEVTDYYNRGVLRFGVMF